MSVDEHPRPWRTGSDRGDVPGPRERTLYGPDGELRGVMFTTEDAKLVVRALSLMERAERVEAAARRLIRGTPSEDGVGGCTWCNWREGHDPSCEWNVLRAALAAAPAPGEVKP